MCFWDWEKLLIIIVNNVSLFYVKIYSNRINVVFSRANAPSRAYTIN